MKKSAGLISFLIIILFMTFTIPADAEKGEVQKITGQLVKASIRHLATEKSQYLPSLDTF